MTFSIPKILNGKKAPTYRPTQDFFPVDTLAVMDMTKPELIEYARDMYDLKYDNRTKASTIVKEIYEHLHGVEHTNRGRPKKVS